MIHIDKVHGSTLTASTACVFSIQLCEKRAKITTLRHVGCVAAIRPRNDIIGAQRVTDSYRNVVLPDRKMYRPLDLIRRVDASDFFFMPANHTQRTAQDT